MNLTKICKIIVFIFAIVMSALIIYKELHKEKKCVHWSSVHKEMCLEREK